MIHVVRGITITLSREVESDGQQPTAAIPAHAAQLGPLLDISEVASMPVQRRRQQWPVSTWQCGEVRGGLAAMEPLTGVCPMTVLHFDGAPHRCWVEECRKAQASSEQL